MAKAYALREGLSRAQFLGCNKIVIQCDNSQVIDTMKEGGFSATSSADIFDDCRLLDTGFREITFKHCNREANEVAHELARCLGIFLMIVFGTMIPLAFYLLSS